MKSKTDAVAEDKYIINFLNGGKQITLIPRFWTAVPIRRNYHLVNTLHLSGTQISLNVFFGNSGGMWCMCVYLFLPGPPDVLRSLVCVPEMQS